jgi:hypothetical protein
MGEFPSHPETSPYASNVDLYCLKCGYNLRGLSGDPRRCPECGHLNPMSDLTVPAEYITQQLRRMETPPALCAGAVTLAIGSVIATGVGRLTVTQFELQGYLFLLPGLLSLLIWKHNANAFRESCLNDPSWKHALWYYHLNAVPLCVLVMLLISLACTLNDLISRRVVPNLGISSTSLMLLSLAIMAVGGYWTHRRVQSVLHPLQRSVAVTMARQYLGGKYQVSRGIFRETDQ